VEVVLEFAQVQRERLVEQAEPGEGLLQAIDRFRGGLEVGVQVVGGRVVGGSFRELPPLFAFASPVKEICARQDEFVAGMAVEVPWTGAAVDDGLEGAEPALGRGAASRQVDGQGLCLFVGERNSCLAGEEFSGIGGAGTGDPDLLQNVFQVRLGEVDLALRHFLGDMAEVTADVGQGGAGAQQAGSQGVAGLVGDLTADVEVVDPVLRKRCAATRLRRRPRSTRPWLIPS
jgi:hypothetical protein